MLTDVGSAVCLEEGHGGLDEDVRGESSRLSTASGEGLAVCLDNEAEAKMIAASLCAKG